MARTGKIIPLLVLLVLVSVLLYGGYIYLHLQRQSEGAARIQAELDVGYQAQVRQYQRVLRIGMPRSEVMEYLESGKIAYRQSQREIAVDLGREPGDGVVCNYWTAYVSLEFSHPEEQAEASAADILTNVSLRKVGHCL